MLISVLEIRQSDWLYMQLFEIEQSDWLYIQLFEIEQSDWLLLIIHVDGRGFAL